jgi:preprotein translocase subunit YajC
MKWIVALCTVWMPGLLFAATGTSVGAGAVSPQGSYGSLLILLALFLFMWLVMWRPQRKRAKEHGELIAAIQKGDEVMTAGGLLGTISKVFDQYLAVELATGCVVMVQKSSISSSLPKGTILSVKE